MKVRILILFSLILLVSHPVRADSLQLFAEAQQGASFNTYYTGGTGTFVTTYLDPSVSSGTYEVESGTYTGGNAQTIISFSEPVSSLYVEWGVGVAPIASWFYVDNYASWFWVEVYSSYGGSLLSEYQTVLANGQIVPRVIGSFGDYDGIYWSYDFGGSNGAGSLTLEQTAPAPLPAVDYQPVAEPSVFVLLLAGIAALSIKKRFSLACC